MKIENSRGYEIEYDSPAINIYNDFGTCLTFEFDSVEQIDQLIIILNDIKNYFIKENKHDIKIPETPKRKAKGKSRKT